MAVQKDNTIKFWQLQKQAELSNIGASEYLEVSKRTVERWRIDKPQAPKAVIIAMKTFIEELNNAK